MSDRHAMVEVSCEICGKPFYARKERVDNGLGRFCSKSCFDIEQRKRREQVYGRKDLATRYKSGDRYIVRWYDENGDTVSESYYRWWWEMNIGEIPGGMVVLLKDGNGMNINPSNFELGTKGDVVKKANKTWKQSPTYKDDIDKRTEARSGYTHSDETKMKLSKAHSGKTLTEKHKANLSESMKKIWKSGRFDNIVFVDISGDKNPHWRGGVSIRYPRDFYEIADFVKSRDNHRCQVCSKDVYRSKHGHVHHRDGNTENNNQDNLLLLCSSCHAKVHANTGRESPPIRSLSAELGWNKP